MGMKKIVLSDRGFVLQRNSVGEFVNVCVCLCVLRWVQPQGQS